VLQTDPQNSFATLWRFIINSTVGIGGLFDVASEAGLKNRPADLGQTLGMYGAGPGPYLVLPIIGPSNARDAVGRLGDALMNPFNYVDQGFSLALWSTTAVDARSRNMKLLDDVYKNSIDPYATFRSGYTQKRAEDIRRGNLARSKALENALCNKP
jgi:phospholipid-binding lipoprotein MlaA